MNYKLLIILVSSLIIYSNSFSCTIFTFTKNGNTYFCNNEDLNNPDSEIRFYPSENGKYAWVYFGFSNNWAQGGVNEKGLCWDWVAGIRVDSWKEDKTKKTINGNPCEKMITECSTVEEAIKFYEKYNEVSFSYARTMIADRFGNSAIIGWKDGEIYIERNTSNLQSYGYKGQEVYSFFSNHIGEGNNTFLAEALDVAHQEGKYPTQYSNIISLSEGKIFLYKQHNYNEYVEINYLKKLNNGYSRYKISHLFDENKRFLEIALIKKGVVVNESLSVWHEFAKYKTDTFSFLFEGNRLSGFVDIPEYNKANAIVILVNGKGKTDYGFRDWYSDYLITSFTKAGLTCVRWDKTGCGKSDGEYNYNQTFQSCAKEINAAINEIKRLKIPGSARIGLWSIGQGGLIAPNVIQDNSKISFWISVNSDNDLDNFPFEFESFLRLSGKSESEAKLLVYEYNKGGDIFESGGSLVEYREAQQNFRNDSLCKLFTGISGEIDSVGYYKEQASIMKNSLHKRDSITKSIILVPDFKKIINNIQCPILAIFGEKDTQIDWKRTMSLYQETLGEGVNNKTTIKTFDNANHDIIKCKTGSKNEQLETYEYCEGYLETMKTWLTENDFIK